MSDSASTAAGSNFGSTHRKTNRPERFSLCRRPTDEMVGPSDSLPSLSEGAGGLRRNRRLGFSGINGVFDSAKSRFATICVSGFGSTMSRGRVALPFIVVVANNLPWLGFSAAHGSPVPDWDWTMEASVLLIRPLALTSSRKLELVTG